MTDIQDIRLTDDTHDLSIEHFDLTLIAGVERVAHNLRIRLWMFISEWFLDTSYGIDYFGELAVTNPSLSKIEAIIKREILKVQDVKKITSFALSLNNATRRMSIEFQVNTTFGTTDTIIA